MSEKSTKKKKGSASMLKMTWYLDLFSATKAQFMLFSEREFVSCEEVI